MVNFIQGEIQTKRSDGRIYFNLFGKMKRLLSYLLRHIYQNQTSQSDLVRNCSSFEYHLGATTLSDFSHLRKVVGAILFGKVLVLS